MLNNVQVGSHVIFIDANGIEHNALVYSWEGSYREILDLVVVASPFLVKNSPVSLAIITNVPKRKKPEDKHCWYIPHYDLKSV